MFEKPMPPREECLLGQHDKCFAPGPEGITQPWFPWICRRCHQYGAHSPRTVFQASTPGFLFGPRVDQLAGNWTKFSEYGDLMDRYHPGIFEATPNFLRDLAERLRGASEHFEGDVERLLEIAEELKYS